MHSARRVRTVYKYHSTIKLTFKIYLDFILPVYVRYIRTYRDNMLKS